MRAILQNPSKVQSGFISEAVDNLKTIPCIPNWSLVCFWECIIILSKRILICFGHENCLQTQDNKCVSDLWSTELARSDHRRTCQLSLPIAVAGWSLCFLFEDPYRICVSSSAWTRLGMFLPGTPLETSVLQRNNSAQWIEMASKICSKNHENNDFRVISTTVRGNSYLSLMKIATRLKWVLVFEPKPAKIELKTEPRQDWNKTYI